jgi:ferredoxin
MAHSYRIEVDLDKCVGSRICVAIAPKVFGLNGDGQASVIDAAGDTLEAIRMAAEGCPISAITVQEVDEEKAP